MNRHNFRKLSELINDIDEVIAKVHSTRMDFHKGSLAQRLINDLDGARVTTRALIQIEEQNQCKPNPSAD